MNMITRFIILVLLLVPFAAPASAAAPMSEAPMMQHHADMAADHACCDERDESDKASVATDTMAEHMSCDGSCSDCQHYCGASALALLPNFSAVRAMPEQRQWQPTLANLITRKDRLERPPMPANS